MDGKILIPKPCHENWNKMTPEEQGRHCAVCSKVVKDFTSMKKNEIIDVLKQTESEVCGRISIKEITPTNKRQKIHFLINGWLYRKAVYPIMALLGVILVNKKVTAQTDYPVKGKMDYRDYHTNNKKVTLIVKTKNGNKFVTDATINVVDGVRNIPASLKTNQYGKTVLDIDADNLIGDAITIEIYSPGYEYKTIAIKLIKDTQTVEIRMEDEMMIMGEMMYIPEEIDPEILTNDTAITIKDDMIKVDKTDAIATQEEIVKVCKCSIMEITKLPLILNKIEEIEVDHTEYTEALTSDINVPKDDLTIPLVVQSKFEIYPNPATDLVNIATTETENFNLDLFDANGKKLQSVMNGNSRYTLDFSGYSSGRYYVIITVGGKPVETKKIIVNR